MRSLTFCFCDVKLWFSCPGASAPGQKNLFIVLLLAVSFLNARSRFVRAPAVINCGVLLGRRGANQRKVKNDN